MEQSILKCTKKVLGIGETDASFDLDILTHINSAFSTLHQLGVGPIEGFVVEDDSTEWDAFGVLAPPIQNQIKTYIYLKARMLFDPPTTPYHIAAMEKQIQEHEWRINTMREEVAWSLPEETPDAIDGGEEGVA